MTRALPVAWRVGRVVGSVSRRRPAERAWGDRSSDAPGWRPRPIIPRMRRVVHTICSVAMLTGCEGEEPPAVDLSCVSAELGPRLAATEVSAAVPFVDGAFAHVFQPSGTRYLNDHTVVRGPDGRWHLFGITHTSLGMPFAERSLLHAVAPNLDGPWSELPDALRTEGDEQALWAPFVFEASPGRWVMYYWGATPEQRVQRADSEDLSRWIRVPRSAPGGRDPFVLRVGSEWLLYSVGVSAASRGQILVASSADLETWSQVSVALEDPVPCFAWGNLESPTVVERGGVYYLFVTRTSASSIDYARTVVMASRDPRRFAWAPVTELLSHAAEVVFDGPHAFLTSAGWTSRVGERWRGLSITRLGWAAR